MSCGVKFAKFILIFFNIIFFLTGACLLAIGLWLQFDDNISERIDTLDDVNEEDPYLEYMKFAFMAIGAFILVFGFLGCCGAIRESSCMLGLYILILAIVMCVEIAAGVLILVYRDRVEEEIVDEWRDSFKDDYKYNATTNKWSSFAKLTNFLQMEFECCGIDGPEDYTDVKEENIPDSPNSRWCAVGGSSPIVYRPATCFELKSGKSDEDEDKLACDDVKVTSLNTDGCRDDFEDFVETYAIIFIALALGFACLQIFGLIFAICLCRVGGKGE